MPVLIWIGKSAVVNHSNDVPFHLLLFKPKLSIGEVWEKASAGRCLFEIPEEPDFGLIRAKIGAPRSYKPTG
jgi:hypothetical protein